MGQILNRIYRIVKSNIDDASLPADPIAAENAELKKIIDDLNRDKQKAKEEKKAGDSGKRQEQQREPSGSGKISDTAEACRILGLPASASVDEIKSAYRTRMKEYHPDKVANLGEELKNLAWKKTQEFNAAYEYLKNIKHF